MKKSNSIEYDKIVKNLVFLVLCFAVIGFFLVRQYLFSFLTLGLLIVFLKIDSLKKLVLKGGFEAHFDVPKEKIENDIKENKEPVTEQNFIRFEKIEMKILADLHDKIGGEMKKAIHFMYGQPDKIQFAYTPDAVIKTKNELIFVEIKHILKPELAATISKKALNILTEVYSKFEPAAGMNFEIKLILASKFDLAQTLKEFKKYEVPKGIDIIFYKL